MKPYTWEDRKKDSRGIPRTRKRRALVRGTSRLNTVGLLMVERHRQPPALRWKRFVKRHPAAPVCLAMALAIPGFFAVMWLLRLWP